MCSVELEGEKVIRDTETHPEVNLLSTLHTTALM